MIRLLSPENEQQVCLATARQLEFLHTDRKNVLPDSLDWLELQKQTEGDHTMPNPVELRWEGQGPVTLTVLEEDRPFRSLSCTGGRAYLENLKIGTRYCWWVQGEKEASERFTFYTREIPPRWIRVEGTTNVRDCGGWRTVRGERLRQGLLYRGSELNGHVEVTPEGLRVLREELGIRTVLDIRGINKKKEEVKDVYQGGYCNLMAAAYDSYFEALETNRQIFSVLADPERYPIYLHCWGGADRTGTVVLLLQALLGVPYDTLILDYELTSLSIWKLRSRNSELFQSLLAALDRYPGKTLQEKTQAFMLESGVTPEQIAGLRAILLEDQRPPEPSDDPCASSQRKIR